MKRNILKKPKVKLKNDIEKSARTNIKMMNQKKIVIFKMCYVHKSDSKNYVSQAVCYEAIYLILSISLKNNSICTYISFIFFNFQVKHK